MNLKKAKALRKQAGFHPTDERKYIRQQSDFDAERGIVHPIWNHPKTTRGVYLLLKANA
jgi:hypothetical protein